MIGGLLREALSPKAFIFEKNFQIPLKQGPYHRLIPDFVVSQDDAASCVPASIAWTVNFIEKAPKYNWRDLWERTPHTEFGAKPNRAFYIAWKSGWFGSYYEILDVKNPLRIEACLALGPVLVGLPVNRLYWAGTDINTPLRFGGDYDLLHMCVIVDTDEHGNFKVVDWSDPNKQAWRMIHREYPIHQAFMLFKDAPPVPRRAGFIQAISTTIKRFLWMGYGML